MQYWVDTFLYVFGCQAKLYAVLTKIVCSIELTFSHTIPWKLSDFFLFILIVMINQHSITIITFLQTCKISETCFKSNTRMINYVNKLYLILIQMQQKQGQWFGQSKSSTIVIWGMMGMVTTYMTNTTSLVTPTLQPSARFSEGFQSLHLSPWAVRHAWKGPCMPVWLLA